MSMMPKLLSTKPCPRSRRQGLRKLSADLIGRARDENAAQVTRVGLTFLGTTAFCLLSLLSPDSALLGGGEKINVPFAGPVSFVGFMLLGPAVLIVLRAYLQIYVDHGERLDRIARSLAISRAPTLVPLQNVLLRLFGVLIFYSLLPVAMLLFAWKAAVFPAWGVRLFGVAVAVIVVHAMLPFARLSWPARAGLSVGVAGIAVAGLIGVGPPHRPFNLVRANLSGEWFPREKALRGANLSGANLSGIRLNSADLRDANFFRANLRGANLLNADLKGANLTSTELAGADLGGADLRGARLTTSLRRTNLRDAKLSGAYLMGASLDGAFLNGADLRGALGVTQSKLDSACGTDTKLREDLTIKPCTEFFRRSVIDPPEGLRRSVTLRGDALIAE